MTYKGDTNRIRNNNPEFIETLKESFSSGMLGIRNERVNCQLYSCASEKCVFNVKGFGCVAGGLDNVILNEYVVEIYPEYRI